MLLWLLRTAIMVLLGMAFAMPMLRSRGLGFLGDAPRDVAIVIDASYSMGYNTGRETVWDKARETATAIIEGLGENDRFCIFVAREQPEILVAEPIGDKEEGINRLTGLSLGNASSQLAPATMAALEALGEAGGRREREIHIITDNQALPWQSFGGSGPGDPAAGGAAVPAGAAWDADLVDKRTSVFVSVLGVPNPENTAPASIDLQPAVIRPGAGAQIAAGLSTSGRSGATAATLFVNGKQIARRSLDPTSADGSAPMFSLPLLPPGTHSARIETPDDNLPVDNTFHFLVRVEDQLPSLCVGTPQDTLFVRTALQAGASPGSQPPTTVAPSSLASKSLSEYACVFLCNALPLSGQDLNAIERYVKGGGLLVLFPGLGAPINAYDAWTCLPGKPKGVEEVAWSQRRRILVWDEPQHPLIRPLRQGIGDPAVTVRRRLHWDEFHDKTKRLVSMGAEQPFLLERPFGDGRVVMAAVSADRTWSDFPLSPFYLPLISQCVDYTFGFGSKAPYIWATDSLTITDLLPEAGRGATLIAPDKIPVPVRSAVVEGRTSIVAEDLTAPGIYKLVTSEEPQGTPAIAVNIPRGESDLTPLPTEDIAARLGVPKVQIATDKLGLERAIEEHRVGRTYGEHLLWIALALIVIEFFYANALLRAKPKLSDDLGVDASGKLGTKPHAANG